MDQTTPAFFAHIRELIARDELSAALQQLRNLLDNSPKLDEAIQQQSQGSFVF